MPHYYFNSADGARERDREGTELADDAAAQVEAVKFAGEVLKDAPEWLWERGQWRVEVTNDDGELLFAVIMLAMDAPKPGEGRIG